jgi:hypothetical protein
MQGNDVNAVELSTGEIVDISTYFNTVTNTSPSTKFVSTTPFGNIVFKDKVIQGNYFPADYVYHQALGNLFTASEILEMQLGYGEAEIMLLTTSGINIVVDMTVTKTIPIDTGEIICMSNMYPGDTVTCIDVFTSTAKVVVDVENYVILDTVVLPSESELLAVGSWFSPGQLNSSQLSSLGILNNALFLVSDPYGMEWTYAAIYTDHIDFYVEGDGVYDITTVALAVTNPKFVSFRIGSGGNA